MVFATDFDPIDSRSSSKKVVPSPSTRRKSSQAHLSPVHQTNRLIAQAQAQKAAQLSAQQVEQESQLSANIAPVKFDDAAEIEVASRGHHQTVSKVADVSPSVAPLVTPLRKPNLPFGLKVLNRVQHGSTLVASVLIAGALALYGSSVYVDRSVNRTMSHLNQLQSESQQLTTANESLKQSLAEQAMQEGSGLEPYEAGDVLFVEPAPLREEKEVAETEQVERFKPLGY